jgi:ribosomal-protein-serine acetyltransferase
MHWFTAAEARPDIYYFCVYCGDALVGQILLHDIDREQRTSLIAYHLFEPHNRGRGIGTSALRLLLRFVVEQTDLATLIIITSRDNLASQRIAQKCGFRYVGASREDPVSGVVFEWGKPE